MTKIKLNYIEIQVMVCIKEELKEVVGQLRKKGQVHLNVLRCEFLASARIQRRRNLQGVDKRGPTSECGNCL